MLTRRGFLGALAAGAAGLAIDPEQLLWRPGAKTFFLPPNPWTATTSGLLVRGDIVTISGHYARNPVTGLLTPHLQHFVITEAVQAHSTVTLAQIHPSLCVPPSGAVVRPAGTWH